MRMRSRQPTDLDQPIQFHADCINEHLAAGRKRNKIRESTTSAPCSPASRSRISPALLQEVQNRRATCRSFLRTSRHACGRATHGAAAPRTVALQQGFAGHMHTLARSPAGLVPVPPYIYIHTRPAAFRRAACAQLRLHSSPPLASLIAGDGDGARLRLRLQPHTDRRSRAAGRLGAGRRLAGRGVRAVRLEQGQRHVLRRQRRVRHHGYVFINVM